MTNLVLEMRNITKTFPGVVALDRVSFDCIRGEVHAVVGENGAGKSTLMKILAGAYRSDEGEIVLKGQPVHLGDPSQALQRGISTIYQEFNLLPYMSVAENISLGREPMESWGLINRDELERKAKELLDRLGADVNPNTLVGQLSVAQQQMVEIAKALSFNADIIIMDEPSASLAGDELERLFEIIEGLRAHGVTVIYVSHRLEEIFRIADRVTVLKDGQVMGTLPVQEADRSLLIRMMVGRTLSETFPPRSDGDHPEILRVQGLSRGRDLRDINLTLRRGEILGLAGLVGSGRTHLVRAIFGADPIDRGEIFLNGQRLHITNPRQAMEAGLGLVTEDRKREGLVLGLSVRQNVALPSLEARQRGGFIDEQAERQTVSIVVEGLQIHLAHLDQEVQFLSGGNQQKVVLAKWLVTEPEVVLFDEPTRGIDVGAKAEIYSLMRDLANQGKAILMVSSELPEIIGMSDRILVMRDGHIVGELLAEEATEEKILTLATGSDGAQAARRGAADPGAGDHRRDEGDSQLGPSEWLGRMRSWIARGTPGSSWTVLAVYGVLVALVLFAMAVSPSFRTPQNIGNILRQSIALGMVSIGQTFAVLAGGIDVSVSSVITLTTVFSAGFMQGRVEMILPVVLFCLALGAAIGIANGLAVVNLNLPPFIATFGMWSIGRGIALVYTKGPVGRIPKVYRFFADGQLGPVPFPFLVLVTALVASFIVLHRTRFGRYVYAVGGKPGVARLSGIRTRAVQVATYVISGVAAAIAGLYMSSRMGVGDPNVGPGFEWDSITAVVVGGSVLGGGRGTLAGTLAGVLMIITLNNVMNQLNVNFWYQQVIKGLIILVAVMLYQRK